MHSPRRTRVAGFSLVELMIVVFIIGVLVSVGLPSYRQWVLAAGRAEGQRLLLEVAANQERFYASNNSYSTDADPLSNPAVAVLTSDGGRYQVSVAACAGGTITNCFVATATPQGAQTADSCSTLSINSLGVRGATGDSVANCWG